MSGVTWKINTDSSGYAQQTNTATALCCTGDNVGGKQWLGYCSQPSSSVQTNNIFWGMYCEKKWAQNAAQKVTAGCNIKAWTLYMYEGWEQELPGKICQKASC